MPQSDESMPNKSSKMLIYQAEDGKTKVDVRVEGETVWATQAGLSELYQTTTQNINTHIKSIYDERELSQEATCKFYLQVRQEGGATNPTKA